MTPRTAREAGTGDDAARDDRDAGVRALRCPHCEGPLERTGKGVVCRRGHVFDAARQGYLHLARGRTPPGDDAQMIACRVAVFEAGVFEPLTAHLSASVSERVGAGGVILDVGAGAGAHLAGVVEAIPDSSGIAVDSSKYAARRAARAHPRITAVVADVWDHLPVGSGGVSVVMDVFAPRNGAEFARVLGDDGVLVVVTPRDEHLRELREPLGLLSVDPHKTERVEAELRGRFVSVDRSGVRWQIAASPELASTIVRMGPSARHVDRAQIDAALRRLGDPSSITASVDVATYRPISAALRTGRDGQAGR